MPSGFDFIDTGSSEKKLLSQAEIDRAYDKLRECPTTNKDNLKRRWVEKAKNDPSHPCFWMTEAKMHQAVDDLKNFKMMAQAVRDHPLFTRDFDPQVKHLLMARLARMKDSSLVLVGKAGTGKTQAATIMLNVVS